MRKLVPFILALAFLFCTAATILAAGSAGAPGTNVNAPNAVRGWDDFFKSPATQQDQSLSAAITARMRQWKDPAQAPAPNAGADSLCALCGVAVEARNGYVRLSGKVVSLQQSMAAENIARGTQGTASVINALFVGR
jgi:hypothetical protein